MAEWLGVGLQNQLQRFESARDLKNKTESSDSKEVRFFHALFRLFLFLPPRQFQFYRPDNLEHRLSTYDFEELQLSPKIVLNHSRKTITLSQGTSELFNCYVASNSPQ